MTKLAIFEKEKGKKDMVILNYFRSDYIGFKVLKAVLAATLSFFMVFVLYLLYNFETIMADIYKMDLIDVGKSILVMYLSIVGVYAVIVYAVYTHRYSKAKKELKDYYSKLKRLEMMNSK
ncbi:MAG: hypothetical protein MJZ11_05965 [Lachnospiraceae bacterium]|nr:hypothetical protein [Lachnospiraceae bacterium]